MNILALTGAALAAAAVSVILRQYSREYGMYISIAVSVIVFAVVLSVVTPATELIKELSAAAGTDRKYISVLLKALAVCYITRLASDCCKDSGETAIASRVDFAGKIALLLISVPLFEAILGIVKELINV